MPNLKEIKNRIMSVDSTIKITSAMKMVSASKLKKAHDAIIGISPFSNKLETLLCDLTASLYDENKSIYSEKRDVAKVLLVVVTSNKGLCGSFNSSIIKKVKSLIETNYENQEIAIMTIGKKAYELLSKTHHVPYNHSNVFNNLDFESTSKLAQQLMDLYAYGVYDKICFIYNSFKNPATPIIKVDNYLPITLEKTTQKTPTDYIFEPNKSQLINDLIPKYLKVQLYKTLRDSFASEHGARMTAMHKATDNAKSLQDELKLTYNKARQATITNEILEIVSGAEALNG